MEHRLANLRSFLAWPGAPLAIASAALFGASTPLAKALLGGGVSPWLHAGLLYLGSGLGLAILHYGRRLVGRPSTEAPIARGDWGWMGLVVLSGGIAGPVLLMLGLSTTPAASAALLLNLEGLATMMIAWLALRALLPQYVARCGAHLGQEHLQQRPRPARLQILDYLWRVAGRLDHCQRVARGAAVGVVKDGDWKIVV